MTAVRFVLALALSTAVACSSDTSTPVSPTTIPSTSFTYATTFTVGGNVTRSFEMISSGTVNMTLTSVTPDVALGIGVGIPRVTGSGCNLTRSVVVRAGGSPQLTLAAEPGTWCVRVWDPGTVTGDRVSFSLSVTHN